MKDYIIYIDEAFTGIKRGASVDEIHDTFAYTKLEYVKHEQVSQGIIGLYFRTV